MAAPFLRVIRVVRVGGGSVRLRARSKSRCATRYSSQRGPSMFTVTEPLRPHVRALESLKARMRTLGRRSLDFEMWDRYGRASASEADRARMEADGARDMEQRRATERELESLVTKLRVEAPDAIVAWADAHLDLLAAFIDRCAKAKDDDRDAATGRMVAEEERAQWADVRRGTRSFAHENVVHVHVDAERY